MLFIYYGGSRGVMVTVKGSTHEVRVQIHDEIDCILHSTSTLKKGMDPVILPPAKGKKSGRLCSLVFVRHPV